MLRLILADLAIDRVSNALDVRAQKRGGVVQARKSGVVFDAVLVPIASYECVAHACSIDALNGALVSRNVVATRKALHGSTPALLAKPRTPHRSAARSNN